MERLAAYCILPTAHCQLPLEQTRHDGPERHGVDGLVQEVVSGGPALAQALLGDVAADEEGRDLAAERGSQRADGVDPGAPVLQMIVGDDEVRRLPGELGQGLALRAGGDHQAPPASQEAARPLQGQFVVVDDDDEPPG